MSNALDPVASVRAAIEQSELIRAVASVRRDGGVAFALGDARLRALTAAEIAELERTGNTAEDWSRVRVADGFDPKRVRGCEFHGDIVLGRFTNPVRVPLGVDLPSGVYHCTVANSVIGHDVRMREVRLLANYVVGPSTLLYDCGAISCRGGEKFGCGQELPIAIETGGRDVLVFAEIDVEVAAQIAKRRGDRDLLQAYARAVADYTAAATSPKGIIAAHATVTMTPSLRETYVGPHATVSGATTVSHSCLLSSEGEPTVIDSGACVSDSILQWGSHVSTLAIVAKSVLTEHSHVERHGMVTASIIGPNTGVAEGEVTSCLLGPFVGFHHQALLIAALWPEGKGNVGYGANVGSNHTSKAPDQEFWPGEGLFLGLGVNIKYPADLTRAPYTIIASGVTTLPQKVSFPFSLINNPAANHPGISPAYNEIVPAWLLTDNLFTLKRNEEKYKARNKAKRTRFEFDVFRPDTIDLMLAARRQLESVKQVKEVYTDHDIPGLGKNYMLEVVRKPAIEAYHFYVEYYALLGLKSRVQQALASGGHAALSELLTRASDDQPWEHQRRILTEELHFTDVAAGLKQLPGIVELVAGDVERSKAKDDERGRRIIDDYLEVHTIAAKDRFVRQTWDEARQLQREVAELIAVVGREVG